MRNLLSIAPRLGAVFVLTGALAGLGCATEQKQVRTPYYTLAHPDFWKIKSVAAKPAEPTIVNIGLYGNSIVNEGSGATEAAMYESSQAEVEVRIFAWPEPAGFSEVADPTDRVAQLLFKDPDLKLGNHSLIPQQQSECGREFQRKYTILGVQQAPFDLLSRPGWRTIVLGGKAPGLLLGVISRVPYEQDGGLYCHNLSNMRTQLQTVLAGLNPTAPGTEPESHGGAAKAP